MPITIHRDLIQGTPEWHKARLGLLTASEFCKIVTPAKLQYAQNDKEKTHLFELAAQRVNNYVEPHFESFDMMRGKEEEILARALYSEKYAPVEEVGFVTNDKWGFTLGCSPDGLVGDDGIFECKSRVQKYQFETIVTDGIPAEYTLQLQALLLITERKWLDFASYSNGMNMLVRRVFPDPVIQAALEAAARMFDGRLQAMIKLYESRINDPEARIIPVERREYSDGEITTSEE